MENRAMEDHFTFSEKQLIRLRGEYSQLDDDEFDAFVEQAERLELDPFCRQIYAAKKENGRMQILCTIDGLRIVAERSGKYAGQTPAMWCGPDGVWKDVWLGENPPAACKVGVMRSDFSEPLYAVARFDSYNQGTSYWIGMPDIMISKCAEALALRRAFPARLSGCYSDAEINMDKPAPAGRKQETFDKEAFLADFVPDSEALARISLPDALSERDSKGERYSDKSVETLSRIWKKLDSLMKDQELPAGKKEILQRKMDSINAIFYNLQIEEAESPS